MLDVSTMFDDLDDLGAVARPRPVVRERCDKCGGSKVFRSWTGRVVGPCHACKGTGEREFAQPRDVRERNRQAVADRKSRKAASWKEAHPDEMRWIMAKAPSFAFAAAMADAVAKYGALTDNQLATVRRLVGQDAERTKARDAERAAAPAVSIEPIMVAFEHAVGVWKARKVETLGEAAVSGARVEDVRLRLGAFYVEPSFKYAGALMVFDTASRAVLGKLSDGRFSRFRACDDATESKIVEACADPKGAAIAYGKLTKRCACCGARLTAGPSLERGIGPICADNYGW